MVSWKCTTFLGHPVYIFFANVAVYVQAKLRFIARVSCSSGVSATRFKEYLISCVLNADSDRYADTPMHQLARRNSTLRRLNYTLQSYCAVQCRVLPLLRPVVVVVVVNLLSRCGPGQRAAEAETSPYCCCCCCCWCTSHQRGRRQQQTKYEDLLFSRFE